jgi:hypothetical protein
VLNPKPGRQGKKMVEVLIVLLTAAQLAVSVYMALQISKKP